ncbi:MAG: endolytic transglycosylase MltG [Alphaproteobacteria bacterium]|nr:endolytic transglycosylase MltG [Rickettsiales bacterium]
MDVKTQKTTRGLFVNITVLLFYFTFLVFVLSASIFYFVPVVLTTTMVKINKGDGPCKTCNQFLHNPAFKYPKFTCLSLRIYSLFGKSYFVANHTIDKDMTSYQIVKAIHTLTLHKISIPEGLTVYEVMQLLDKDNCVTNSIVDNVEEGSLMPDTYLFTCGTSKAKIINIMKNAMDDFIEVEWDKRDKNINYLYSARDAVILASIIENEAKLDAERPLIASVFVNRLSKKNMRLQSCATVVYCLTNGRGFSNFRRTVTYEDLQLHCPHNTYRNDGLPPTAISSPSRSSILTVLHPVKTDYLFYVVDKDGGHSFSSSFNKHIANKNKKH